MIKYNGNEYSISGVKSIKYNGNEYAKQSTGETWVINEIITTPTVSFQSSIDFISNNNNFSVFRFVWTVSTINSLEYDTITVYDRYRGAPEPYWSDTAYRTVTFSESPTGDLLTWLQANAVKQ